MYLKKLELIGFKSFVDKTDFVFGSGITGVVGPNGCGKSNVVDAFKWILGEQSAKGLRGSEMKDVIFNGTQGRKAAGYAEVTVVFDNSDRFFDVDYTEVSFTRRLFRSGESEYLTNRQRCRLRDIKEMLMGTGIGASSYSIFEQGKIDVLLQASPVDRRIIFEEAAGISKYRARKAETLRSLQRVEDNLARQGDVISELEKRLRRVKSQAAKARRYRTHSNRLRDLRIRLALEAYRSSMTDRAEMTCQRFLLDSGIGAIDATCDRLRRGLDRHVEMRSAKAVELRDARRKMGEIRGRRERTEESITHDRRRLDELAEQIVREREDLRVAEAALVQECTELAREQEELRAVSVDVERRREALREATARLDELRGAHEEMMQRRDELKRQIVESMEEHSRLGNQLAQVDSELSGLEARCSRLDTQLETAQRERDEARTCELAEQDVVESTRGAVRDLETERETASAAVADLDRDLERLRVEFRALHGDIRGASSRLELLETFEENLEGVSRGIAEILRENDGTPGIHDLVGHLIRVESRFAAAVEAVLGPRSQALVVEDEDGALRLLAEARATEAGAVEVIALERVSPPELLPLATHDGVLGMLSNFVVVDDRYRELVERLLAGVVLVDSLDTAIDFTRNGCGAYRVVTLAGEIVDPVGAMSIPGELSTGLISRRAEMRELSTRLKELEAEAERREAGLAQREEERAARSSELDALTQQRDDAARRVAASESQLEQLTRERERLITVVRVTESELEEVTSEAARRREEKEILGRRLQEADGRRDAMERDAEGLGREIGEHGQQVHQAAESVTELRVALAEGTRREEGLGAAIQKFEKSVADGEARIEALRRDVRELGERSEQTREDLRRSEQAREDIAVQERQCSEGVTRAEADESEIAEIEDGFRAELERLAERKIEKMARRGKVDVQDREGVMRRNATLEKVSDEYGIDLVEILERISCEDENDDRESVSEADSASVSEADSASASEADSASVSEADSASASALVAASGSVLASDSDSSSTEDHDEDHEETLEATIRSWLPGGDDWDRDAAAEEAQEIQRKIRQLGNVNMEALEELDDIQERLTFQVTQRDDLRAAERDLRRIINEINKTSRDMFASTFEEVRANFRELFSKCFGGGKADLVVDEDVDILESGIEIIARPPGKKLTSLSLMSGGEKTMTTIALMFAIFRARPSPFCILDEVDAPLDENNIQRFIVLIRDFVAQSQFIIVTHNKMTMGVADCLYGVTMQERGVSKRVAVEFEKYDPDDPHASMSTGDIDDAPVVEAVPRVEG